MLSADFPTGTSDHASISQLLQQQLHQQLQQQQQQLQQQGMHSNAAAAAAAEDVCNSPGAGRGATSSTVCGSTLPSLHPSWSGFQARAAQRLGRAPNTSTSLLRKHTGRNSSNSSGCLPGLMTRQQPQQLLLGQLQQQLGGAGKGTAACLGNTGSSDPNGAAALAALNHQLLHQQQSTNVDCMHFTEQYNSDEDHEEGESPTASPRAAGVIGESAAAALTGQQHGSGHIHLPSWDVTNWPIEQELQNLGEEDEAWLMDFLNVDNAPVTAAGGFPAAAGADGLLKDLVAAGAAGGSAALSACDTATAVAAGSDAAAAGAAAGGPGAGSEHYNGALCATASCGKSPGGGGFGETAASAGIASCLEPALLDLLGGDMESDPLVALSKVERLQQQVMLMQQQLSVMRQQALVALGLPGN